MTFLNSVHESRLRDGKGIFYIFITNGYTAFTPKPEIFRV